MTAAAAQAQLYAVEQYVEPAPRAEPEVRGLLVEWARNWQLRRAPTALLQSLFTGSNSYITLAVGDDLGKLERMRWSQPGGATASSSQRAPLRTPMVTVVAKSVLLGGAAAAARTYRLLLRGFPSPGAEARFWALMEDQVRKGQEEGLDISLWHPIFSSECPQLAACAYFPDLASCERYQREPVIVARLEALRDISRAPFRHELAEVVVPLPE